MFTHLLALELKEIADALVATVPELAALNRYAAQTGATRKTPSVSFAVEGERLYRGGKSGIVRVIIGIESAAGDDTAPAPANHVSRVALVHRLFVTEKVDRIAALAARGKLTLDDWGQIPGRADTSNDDGAARLRSALVLRAAGRVTETV